MYSIFGHTISYLLALYTDTVYKPQNCYDRWDLPFLKHVLTASYKVIRPVLNSTFNYFQNGDHHEKNKSNLYYRTRQPKR